MWFDNPDNVRDLSQWIMTCFNGILAAETKHESGMVLLSSPNYKSEYTEDTELHRQYGITHLSVSQKRVGNVFVRGAGKVIACVKRWRFKKANNKTN